MAKATAPATGPATGPSVEGMAGRGSMVAQVQPAQQVQVGAAY